MSSPLVSVVIPTFNRCRRVQNAVQSVLDQSYAPLECIVVDDGSSDNTAESLHKRYARNITLIRQSNRGVSAARNRGIQAAAGDWIAFLDSDDVWLKPKLERQMAHMACHAGLMISQTREIWYRKGKRVNPGRVHRKKAGDLFSPSLYRCVITPSSVLMHKTLFDRVGLFDESFPACEDYDLWLRVTLRYSVGLVDEALLMRHGGRPDQLSSQHSLDKYRIAALKKRLNDASLSSSQKAEVQAVLRKKSAIYGKGCLKRGRILEAKAYLENHSFEKDCACSLK